MPLLKEQPTLKHFQQYIHDLEAERGFDNQSAIDKCLLLGEEVGELFKAVRKTEGLNIEKSADYGNVGEELADVFIYLCAIANRFNIDLEAAFRDKEEVNKTRIWEVSRPVT